MGVAAMLSGDYAYAESLLLAAEQRLPAIQRRYPRHAGLKSAVSRVPDRIVTLYGRWLAALSSEYKRTHDRRLLELEDVLADRLLARSPDCYDALLTKAICAFSLRRDIPGARRHLGKCKRVRDAAWRYSAAFLLAYEGRLAHARETYDRAFRTGSSDVTLAVQCEEFIQLVLEEEPHRTQLHFCAGMINHLVKQDPLGARRDLTEFLRLVGDAFAPERQLAERWLREIESGEQLAA